MKSAVLDSYAIIAFLERQSGYQEVAELFEECTAKDREVFICVVNWGEVIYHALRTGGEKKALLAEEIMHAIPVTVLDANREITLQAVKFKAAHKISYADCFAAALAMKKKCELATGDKEFKQVEKEVKVRWM
jgi:predicted nucleic acid-binding protein